MFYANVDKEATLKKVEEMGSRLPKPVGYQILVVKPVIEEATASGIVYADSTRKAEEAGSVLSLVVSMGDLCYRDEQRFPTGPWVKQGDFILIGAYRGARFKISDHEFIMIHDDMPLAVVEDPTGMGRAY